MLVLAGLLAITFNSCKKSVNEDPRARIINNGTQKASVQIKTSNGNSECNLSCCITTISRRCAWVDIVDVYCISV